MIALFNKLNTRSIVVISLLLGISILAIIDKEFRGAYADIAKFAVGGYFGLSIPKRTEG